jgi:protein SCO1/2
MMAMTMPFKLKDSSDINKFSLGDSLHFRLIMGKEKAFASNLKLVGKGTLPDNDDMWKDEYSALSIGQVLSDAKLLDIDSNLVSLSQSDGKFRLISYIFTRCPMPEMCPAVVVKNQYLAKKFKQTPEVEFYLVSFDYVYDTPTLLKKNYANIIDSYPNIRFYSSHKQLNDIFKLAGESAVSFWGIDENDIGHSLRSILIGPERRILKAYEGIDWRPELAEKDISNILKTYSY